MAKPMPWLPPFSVAMATLAPARRPNWSKSGPPELPGLIGASVWISSTSVTRSSRRPLALMMPCVTVCFSPLGLKHTVTHGIISAKGRLLDRVTLVELIQTDAPINPGNSGGPLFDQFGRRAGANVAIATENGGSQGIGFAIPSNTVKKIVDQLVSTGEVTRGYIGVAMDDLTPAQIKALGLKKAGGVQVVQVVRGQAASKAGVRPGDVI